MANFFFYDKSNGIVNLTSFSNWSYPLPINCLMKIHILDYNNKGGKEREQRVGALATINNQNMKIDSGICTHKNSESRQTLAQASTRMFNSRIIKQTSFSHLPCQSCRNLHQLLYTFLQFSLVIPFQQAWPYKKGTNSEYNFNRNSSNFHHHLTNKPPSPLFFLLRPTNSRPPHHIITSLYSRLLNQLIQLVVLC